MSIDENEDKSSHEDMQSQFVEPSGSSKRPRSLRSKNCEKSKGPDIGQMMLDMQGKLKTRKIDEAVVRELIVDLMVKHDLPLRFVEFKELISLTCDLWTSCNMEGFVCLTAHYVDSKWNLQSKIINFQHMPPPHTSFELCQKVFAFLHDWGIEKKIFSITLDNASANDVLQKTLKSQLVLQKGLVYDGEHFHVHCCVNILNLIVQEGLKVAEHALEKIRDSIKYVKASKSRMIKFKRCIEKVGNIEASSGLCLDVPTRWNSTYLMLQSALKYESVFSIFHLDDENYKYCPLEEEWIRARKMCKFLLPFYHITTLMSGTSYPTSNLYFLQVWKIQGLLMSCARDEDEVIKRMAEDMMLKFDKYWDEYSVVLAFGVVFYPRIKFESLGFCYKKIDPLTWEMKVKKVNRKFSSSSVKPPSSSQDFNLFDDLIEYKEQVASDSGKSQLDTYLEEATLNLHFTAHMDVLDCPRFRHLSIMACDLLSIPVTTVASESAFSIGSRILNKYRNRLSSDCVEAIIYDDDLFDEDLIVKTTSKGASNVVDVDNRHTSVLQPKRHDLITKGAPRCDECGFLPILFSHFSLVVSQVSIHEGKRKNVPKLILSTGFSWGRIPLVSCSTNLNNYEEISSSSSLSSSN
uniref:HAT C-terminal dimerisation domain-containing protein n=1 Tax=Glycine max TaxID=3847 RepID=A0A0R0KFT3_SOYBN